MSALIWFLLTEERVLKLFAQCVNRCDFEPIIARLGRKAAYESWNNFYHYRGRDKVTQVLRERAAKLKATEPRERAYLGFMTVQRSFVDIKHLIHCVCISEGGDPNHVTGLVRIRYTPLHILRIDIVRATAYPYTRGEDAGT